MLQTEYQHKIRNNIKDIVNINKESNPNTLWELIKGSIRNETIKYSTFTKKQDTEKENEIKKNIEKLEDLLIKTNPVNVSENIKNTLDTKKIELNNLLDKKVNGILIRSKANIVEHNEKNSKYFANSEKKRAEQKIMTKIDKNGMMIENQKLIRNEQSKFYSKLYDKKEKKHSRQLIFLMII